MKESYIPQAIPRTELLGKWLSLGEDFIIICIFFKIHTINLSLVAAMKKEKYLNLSGFRDSGSEIAWSLETKNITGEGLWGQIKKNGISVCVYLIVVSVDL